MSALPACVLPRGWGLHTIPELVGNDGLFVDGDWIESKDQDPAGDVRLIQLADIGDGEFRDRSNRFLTLSRARELGCTFLQPGDVLVARMPDPLGRACIFPGDKKPCVTAVDVCVVRAGSGDFGHRWLMWWINTPQVRSRIAGLQAGSTRKRISRKNLGTIPLPVPPREEQERIVEWIESHLTRLGAGVAALKRVQANLKRYRAAVLKAACEGHLVPTEAELARRERRHYEPATVFRDGIRAGMLRAGGLPWRPARASAGTRPDPADLKPLPEGWAWTPLPELGELDRGKSRHRPRDDSRLYGGPYPFVQTGDVRRSGGTIGDHTQTYSDLGLRQSRLWPAGTLCITIAANIADTGILAFAACFPDSVVGFLHDGDSVTTRYVELFLRVTKENLKRFAPATAQKNINLDVLRAVLVPLPPLAEQRRIVAEVERRLSLVDELERSICADLARSSRFRQSILEREFGARLVPLAGDPPA